MVEPRDPGTTRRTSESLAVLLIDALVDAGLVNQADFQQAVAVVTEEIEVRKALGDY